MARRKQHQQRAGQRSIPSPLRVVLDTNAVVSRRYRLDGPHVAIMERAILLGALELVVPQIVVEEIRNKHREELLRLQEDVRLRVSKLNLILPSDGQLTFDMPKIDMVAEDFTSRFDKRLNELRAVRPGYSDIPHADIVRRDLERRRPFQETGKGYRDALIWETMLRTAAPKTLTVFVTHNSKDFCVDGDHLTLHHHLVDDLKSNGLSADSVTICDTIETFVDKHLKSRLPTNAEVLNDIRRSLYKLFSFATFFRDNKDIILNELNQTVGQSNIFELAGVPAEDAKAVYVEDPAQAEIVEAYELGDERLFLAYDVLAEVTFEFFVFKTDYYAMDQEADCDILDADWNEHYVWASSRLILPMRISLVLELGAPDEIDSVDVEVKEFFGRCRKCGWPIQNDAAEVCEKCGSSLFAPKRAR